jgi:voltage-gated potassium channel
MEARRLRRSLAVAVYAPYYILRQIWIQLTILASMFLIGALVFMYFQGLDFLTALLGSISTITTIGIYAPNIVAMPDVEKFILIFVFIISVGSAASLLQATVSATIKKGLMTEELSRRLAKRMENHVIVVGYKFLGKYVVESLQSLKIEYIVIARDDSQLEILRSHNIPGMFAPITQIYDALKDTNVDKASTLISTLEDDGDNMLTVMMAKKLNNNIRTISVVNDRELVKGVKDAGADIVIPFSEITGQILALSSVSKEVAGVFLTDNLKSRHVAEFRIKSSGIKYKDINGICPILLIDRKGETITDMGDDFQLEEGDLVYVLTDHESLKAFRIKLNSLYEREKQSKP